MSLVYPYPAEAMFSGGQGLMPMPSGIFRLSYLDEAKKEPVPVPGTEGKQLQFLYGRRWYLVGAVALAGFYYYYDGTALLRKLVASGAAVEVPGAQVAVSAIEGALKVAGAAVGLASTVVVKTLQLALGVAKAAGSTMLSTAESHPALTGAVVGSLATMADVGGRASAGVRALFGGRERAGRVFTVGSGEHTVEQMDTGEARSSWLASRRRRPTRRRR